MCNTQLLFSAFETYEENENPAFFENSTTFEKSFEKILIAAYQLHALNRLIFAQEKRPNLNLRHGQWNSVCRTLIICIHCFMLIYITGQKENKEYSDMFRVTQCPNNCNSNTLSLLDAAQQPNRIFFAVHLALFSKLLRGRPGQTALTIRSSFVIVVFFFIIVTND